MDAATDWVVSGGRYALDLDGTNDFISMPVIQASRSGFLSFWLYNRATTDACYFSYHNSSGGSTTNIFMCEQDDSAGTFRFLVRGGSGTILDALSPSSWITLNQWIHILIVMPPSGGLQLYRNGTQAALTFRTGSSSTRAWTSDVSGADTCTIGRFVSSVTRYPNCLIDDFFMGSQTIPLSLLNQRRGIAYERRKRRSVFFNAAFFNSAWARNSNVILSPVGAA